MRRASLETATPPDVYGEGTRASDQANLSSRRAHGRAQRHLPHLQRSGSRPTPRWRRRLRRRRSARRSLTNTTDNGSIKRIDPLRLHDRFEWNSAKAKANLRKHAVSFDDAATVLADEQGERFHVEEYDDAHSMEEDRWITTASHPSDRRIVLRIVWTPRSSGAMVLTRIIGARPATRQERTRYEDEIANR